MRPGSSPFGWTKATGGRQCAALHIPSCDATIRVYVPDGEILDRGGAGHVDIPGFGGVG